MFSIKLDLVVHQIEHSRLGFTGGLYIPKVSHVSYRFLWPAMVLFIGVVVGSCSSASVAEISKFMNVESMQTSFQSVDFSLYSYLITFLLEFDNAIHSFLSF